MDFQHYNLGYLNQGQAVEISLQGNAANVILVDSTNFDRYRRGQQFQHYGGYVTTSITKLPVPRTGHWHVAIDLGGRSGKVASEVRVLG
ncbi:DUF1883 domain-containing protein [Aliivibrio fischeri]|uniref:DUF1883 domain-containing protein n=1 Tax=Aliivibrio fischeri TaxID=668 RepID=UPI001F3CFD41|nr:DUF1883 domain-containing protein [Aliivibrio fischeri]